MTTRKPKTKQASRKSTEARPPAFYRINALLHTMRSIEAHEERLCSLMNEIKTADAVSPEVLEELRDVLDSIPSDEYLEDLTALRRTL